MTPSHTPSQNTFFRACIEISVSFFLYFLSVFLQQANLKAQKNDTPPCKSTVSEVVDFRRHSFMHPPRPTNYLSIYRNHIGKITTPKRSLPKDVDPILACRSPQDDHIHIFENCFMPGYKYYFITNSREK